MSRAAPQGRRAASTNPTPTANPAPRTAQLIVSVRIRPPTTKRPQHSGVTAHRPRWHRTPRSLRTWPPVAVPSRPPVAGCPRRAGQWGRAAPASTSAIRRAGTPARRRSSSAPARAGTRRRPRASARGAAAGRRGRRGSTGRLASWSSRASASRRSRPAAGPSAIATATARLSSTTGDGASSARRPYSAAIWRQSVGARVRGDVVERRDRRLDLVRPGPAHPQRAIQERLALVDLGAVPAAAVLVLEEHELAVRPGPRVAPRVVQEHQREQAERLGLVGHELGEDARQPDRLGRELAPDERLAGRRAVALVEDQVEDPQHARRGAPAAARAAGRGTGSRRRGSSAWPGRAAGRASPRARGTRGRSPASSARRGSAA